MNAFNVAEADRLGQHFEFKWPKILSFKGYDRRIHRKMNS